MSANEQPGRTRVILLVVAVVVGAIVAMVPLFASITSDDSTSSQSQQLSDEDALAGDQTAPEEEEFDSSQSIVIDNPRSCPQPPEDADTQLAADSELAGIDLPCLSDGGAIDESANQNLGKSLVGKPTVINVWAWWCEPCRRELPIFDTVAEDNEDWNVVGVHLDSKAQAGADFLDDLDVTLMPSFEDGNHAFDSATEIPNVVPITLVYNADGTRAGMFPQTFKSEEELEQTVREALG